MLGRGNPIARSIDFASAQQRFSAAERPSPVRSQAQSSIVLDPASMMTAVSYSAIRMSGRRESARVTPRQPLEPWSQVVTEEPDHPSLERRQPSIQLICRLRKFPALEQGLQDRQYVSFTAFGHTVISA